MKPLVLILAVLTLSSCMTGALLVTGAGLTAAGEKAQELQK